MKSCYILFLLLIFSLSSFSAVPVEDDCPCRKKPVVKIIPKPKVKPAPVRKYPKYELYPEGINPPPPLADCPNQRAVHQRDDMRVKILPNPVMEIINLVYTIEETAPVKIELLACDGRVIETLMHKTMRGGTNHSSFNILGKVRPGAAYVRLTSGVTTKVEKIMIL
jgi:hypothetical protein